MPEILSLGGGREPGPWPRRVTVIAVLLLVAVLIIEHLPRHRQAAPRPSRAAVSASPVPLAFSGSHPGGAGLTGQPDSVTRGAIPWMKSLRLPVTGDQPALVWPATGRSTVIGGLPRDRSGYQFIRMAGGWAVQAMPAALPSCGSCAGPRLPVYFLPDHARSVMPVGTADEVAPGADPGAMWLTSYLPGADVTTAAGTAREVGVSGQPLGPPVRLPAGYVILHGTVRGLLLEPVTPRPARTGYELWNPSAASARRVFAGVIAASATDVAWAPAWSPGRRVHVLHLASGRATAVGLPAASSVASAAFSPGGGLLALQVSFYNGGDGELAMQLDVVSMASGRLTVVPGTWVSSDALVAFGWPAGTDLVAELSFTASADVVSWHPGAARLAVAVIRPGASSASLIVGYPR